jgi:hypothetical protein
MTSGHLFYIPIMLLLGLVVGWHLGKQSAERAAAQHNERARERGGRRRRAGEVRGEEDDGSAP